jgi:hypothetical protein
MALPSRCIATLIKQDNLNPVHAIPRALYSIHLRSGDGPEGRRQIGGNQREAAVEGRGIPRTTEPVASPAAG